MAANDPEAKQTLEALITDVPGDFYALRAEVLLGENDDDTKDVEVKDHDVDWDDVAGYIEDNYGADPEATPPADDPRWNVAKELRDVGLRAQGDAVYRSLIDGSAHDVDDLYHVTRRFEEFGDTSLAARAAAMLVATLHDDGKPEPPDDLLRVAYPPAFPDLVQDAADEQDVPSLLLLALVRQESFYDPDAGSTAGALGLTQVIEGTGRAIADDLGVFGFSVSDLYRPRLSLRFGASYLADQLAQFDGNAYYALAAYNGGPGTSFNAIDSAGDDLDLFVEDLEFDETRLYVKLVMQNYARYRQLYEGVDRPSLPR
jgi:soluble lytic murein transglycosylase